MTDGQPVWEVPVLWGATLDTPEARQAWQADQLAAAETLASFVRKRDTYHELRLRLSANPDQDALVRAMRTLAGELAQLRTALDDTHSVAGTQRPGRGRLMALGDHLVAAFDTGVVARLDAEGGLVWATAVPPGPLAHRNAALTLADDAVVVAGPALLALELDDGSVRWNRGPWRTPGAPFPLPDGTLLLPDGARLDMRSGAPVEPPLPGPLGPARLVDDTTVVRSGHRAGTHPQDGSQVTRISLTGRAAPTTWSVPTTAGLAGTAHQVGDVLLAVDQDGRLWAFGDEATEALAPASPARLAHAPVWHGEELWLVHADQTHVMVHLPEGEPITWRAPAPLLAPPVRVDEHMALVREERALTLWERPTP